MALGYPNLAYWCKFCTELYSGMKGQRSSILVCIPQVKIYANITQQNLGDVGIDVTLITCKNYNQNTTKRRSGDGEITENGPCLSGGDGIHGSIISLVPGLE
jgi:hypothetical protein